MFIVMGGTGHVGGAMARTLLAQGETVTIVTRDATRATVPDGATIVEADIADPDRLRAVFRTGRRAFILNPPGPVDGDTDAAETRSVDAILAALDRSGLEQVVAASTYGAQQGTRIGDLGTLYRLEEGLRARPVPTVIQRGAYYMSNWDTQLAAARDEGRIVSFFPADMPIPMVAPSDVGAAAARWLTGPAEATGVRHVEGPARYSATDVARAFADALGREVRVDEVPRDQWAAMFRRFGFSSQAAESYAGMTALAVDRSEPVVDLVRGPTPLATYIADLVGR